MGLTTHLAEMTRLRSRLKGDNKLRDSTHLVDRRYTANGPIINTIPIPGVLPPKNYELFVDEVESDKYMKEAYHISSYCEDEVGFVAEQAGGYHYTNQHKGNVLAAFPNAQSHYDITSPLRSALDLEAFNKRAIESMKPGIETAIDVPTFLTELGSLPDLFKSGVLTKWFGNSTVNKNIASALKDPKSSKKYLEMVKEKAKKYDTRIEKDLAGDYLNLQFGWLPTVADAKALYATIRDIKKKLDELVKRQDELFKSHYTEYVDVDIEGYYGQNAYTDYLEVKHDKVKVKMTASLHFRYKIPGIDDLRGKLPLWKAYLDALGFNNPLRTIWERVPFSFIVDWFIPVGDFLEQFSQKWLDTKVEYLDYCLSYKTVTPCACAIKAYRAMTKTDLGGCKIYSQHYSRMRAIPNDDKFGLRVNNRFGTHQAVLSGALLTSFFGGKKQ